MSGSEYEKVKYTISKKSLVILFLISLIMVLILIVVLNFIFCHDEERKDLICLTPTCVHSASTMLNKIATSIDPCDDFYQFACGSYLENSNVPPDKVKVDSFSAISDVIQEEIKTIIDELQTKQTKRPYSMIKDIYNVCMNSKAIEMEGLTTLKTILDNLGGWPVLEGDSWNGAKFDWKDAMYKSRKLGISTSKFIKFTVETDKANSSRRLIHLDQIDLDLKRDYLIKGFEEMAVKVYYDYIVDIAVLFGANHPVALKEFNETLEFEMNLAKICLTKEEYNPMTVEELQYKYSFIPWLEYLNNVLDVPDIEITEDEEVNVVAPKYLSDLIFLLRRTPKRVQANYIISSIVSDFAFLLPKKFRDRTNEYFNIVYGLQESPAKWRACVSAASNSLPLAISALYIRKHFNAEEIRNNTKKIIVDIQDQLTKALCLNGWMNEETKISAIEKVTSMFIHIGYANELLDERQIERYYSNLEIDTNSYLKTLLAVKLFETDNRYKQLKEAMNPTDWTTLSLPIYTEGLYDPKKNRIELPAGILQGVFFNKNRPHYMNYGRIGYIIGQKIIHAFDNLELWNNKAEFTEAIQCIINQYENLSIPFVGLKLNWAKIQNETIADTSGIKHAYLAYQAWAGRNDPEPHLPGLPYTPNQLFWISAAQAWCAKYTNEYLKILINIEHHLPAKYKILIPFRNTEYFSEDFKCPVGSKMNPKHKCQVW